MAVTRRGPSRGPASAGVRDRYVLVQWRPVEDAVETSGLPRDEWTDYRHVYMSRTVLTSDERFAADQMTASSLARWECEYLADMDPDIVDVPKRFRLIFGARTFDVIAAMTIGRQRAIELVTLAGSGAAA